MKLLHCADLHLDSPFRGLSREKGALRRSEQRALLLRLPELVKEEGADLAVFAGDLFDSDSLHPETGRALAQSLGAMEVPVFIAPGNHDPFFPGCLWERLSFAENVHIFSGDALECVELPELSLRVWGSAFRGGSRGAPLAGFSVPKRAEGFDLLVLHGDAENPASPYAPVSAADIARSGFDYVALGHLHERSGLRRAGGTFYAWPGCPEGRGFDETGDKGAYLVTLGREPDGRLSCEAEFRPLAARRYLTAEISLTGSEDDLGRILESLPGDTENDIYRLLLTGECAVPPDVNALKSALAPRFFALDVRDGTEPPADFWSAAGEQTLRGLFLQRMHELYRGAGGAEKERVMRAVRLGLRAMQNGEEEPLP